MACGSCGQRYNEQSPYLVVGGKGTTQGVIKAADFAEMKRREEAHIELMKRKKEGVNPQPSTPVAGVSGPADETE